MTYPARISFDGRASPSCRYCPSHQLGSRVDTRDNVHVLQVGTHVPSNVFPRHHDIRASVPAESLDNLIYPTRAIVHSPLSKPWYPFMVDNNLDPRPRKFAPDARNRSSNVGDRFIVIRHDDVDGGEIRDEARDRRVSVKG